MHTPSRRIMEVKQRYHGVVASQLRNPDTDARTGTGGRSVQGGDSRALGRPWTCFIREASTAGGRASGRRSLGVGNGLQLPLGGAVSSSPRISAIPCTRTRCRLARRADLTLPPPPRERQWQCAERGPASASLFSVERFIAETR